MSRLSTWSYLGHRAQNSENRLNECFNTFTSSIAIEFSSHSTCPVEGYNSLIFRGRRYVQPEPPPVRGRFHPCKEEAGAHEHRSLSVISTPALSTPNLPPGSLNLPILALAWRWVLQDAAPASAFSGSVGWLPGSSPLWPGSQPHSARGSVILHCVV